MESALTEKNRKEIQNTLETKIENKAGVKRKKNKNILQIKQKETNRKKEKNFRKICLKQFD